LNGFFTPETFRFLGELAANNRRDWFEQNRQRYEDAVRTPALDFIAAMAPMLASVSPHFTAIPSKQGGSLMRVFRDTRFSRDKSPYKTNIGIHFRHALGRDVHAPGFYVHIAPDEVFLAAGIWRPGAGALTGIRTEINRHPRRWLAARDDAAFGRSFSLGGESLVRVPRGFDAAHSLAADLKRKDFIGICPMLPESVTEADFAAFTAARFADGAPLMRFLCRALGLAY
jgi:uncharacterized protein (TIGR02453 family)